MDASLLYLSHRMNTLFLSFLLFHQTVHHRGFFLCLAPGAQIYGHYVFEKSKPAFLDNLFQALVSAPLFVVADVFFELGLRKDLEEQVKNVLKERGVYKDFSKLAKA